MKKGFTLIELLVVIAIIGILSSLILAALTSARCKKDPTKCDTPKTTQGTISSIAASTGRPVIDYNSPDYCNEAMATSDFGCGCVTDPLAKKECETEGYKSQMIQECIMRYSN